MGEPTRPPTNQWTVDEDGWFHENSVPRFRIGSQMVMSSYVLDTLNRAAALGGGHEVEALRTVEPTLGRVHEAMADEFRTWTTRGQVQAVLDARAALVREQTEEPPPVPCDECETTGQNCRAHRGGGRSAE